MSEQTDVNVAATHHSAHPLSSYLAVYGTLLVLTGITVGVSYLNLGPLALYAALFVAFIKAGLVLGFFMHLKYDSRFHQVIVFGSLIFILILFGFTFIDLSSRARVSSEQGNFALAHERESTATLQAIDEQNTRSTKAPPPASAASPTSQPTPTAPPKAESAPR